MSHPETRCTGARSEYSAFSWIWATTSEPKPAGAWGLLDHHRPTRLLDRADDRLDVERDEAAEVDHLSRNAFAGELFDGTPGLLGHRSVGDERDIGALGDDPCLSDRDGVVAGAAPLP